MEGFTTPTTHGKLSLRASITGELVFDNVKVPKGNLIPGRRHVWLYYGDGSFFKLVMTDNQGIMQLGLNAGSYRFLTHYPGNNRNWSEVFSVPETTNITIVTK